jgi:hypothetical protein
MVDDGGFVERWRTARVGLFFFFVALTTMGNRCNEGNFDGGIEEDAGTVETVTAADIGTLCTYVSGSGQNPTNTCANRQLQCLIRTFDGAYTPFAGAVQRLANSVWEDQMTVYRPEPNAQNEFIDEGYCTLIGSWTQPPACPVGTELKLFTGDIAACLRTCTASAQCDRSGYVCDRRYLDTLNSTCVRACGFDVADCIRSGVLTTQADPTKIGSYLASQDFQGESYCEVSTGICQFNTFAGNVPPGMPCDDTRDCAGDQLCYQRNVLNTPDGSKGFCGLACAPNPNAPLEGCPTGYACQAGFQFGHSPFALKDIVTGQDLSAGGVCLPECASVATSCSAFQGTTCAQIDTAVFGAGWNGVSMCLLPELAQ